MASAPPQPLYATPLSPPRQTEPATWPPPHRQSTDSPHTLTTLEDTRITALATSNVRGAKSVLPEIRKWLIRHRPAVLALQETLIHPDFDDLSVPGYWYFGTPAKGPPKQRKCGPAFLVRHDLAALCTVTNTTPGKSIWLTVTSPNGTGPSIVPVYLPSNSLRRGSWKRLKNTVRRAARETQDRIILMGDLNETSSVVWRPFDRTLRPTALDRLGRTTGKRLGTTTSTAVAPPPASPTGMNGQYRGSTM